MKTIRLTNVLWVCVCAELHQTQLTIQRDLATLQAAVSQSKLPVEARPDQEGAIDNQQAVLANTESLLHAMEVRPTSANVTPTVCHQGARHLSMLLLCCILRLCSCATLTCTTPMCNPDVQF